MKKVLILFFLVFMSILVSCKKIDDGNKFSTNIAEEINITNEKINDINNQLAELSEKVNKIENLNDNKDNEVINPKYTMEEITGYYRIDAPNIISIYIDKNMIIETSDKKITVYPITDYRIIEDKLLADVLILDDNLEYDLKTTKVYTIYGANDNKSIRKSLNPTQENGRYHFRDRNMLEIYRESIDFDKIKDTVFKWKIKENIRI